MNILVIDDDQMLPKLISHTLLESGYTLSVAGNGNEALKILEQNKNVDVIVVDLFMPEMTGPSFLLTIKNWYHTKFPKVIVTSGIEDGETFLKKIDVPYDYFLHKPIDMAQLKSMLEEIQKTLMK